MQPFSSSMVERSVSGMMNRFMFRSLVFINFTDEYE
jgi:hypothetical protein